MDAPLKIKVTRKGKTWIETGKQAEKRLALLAEKARIPLPLIQSAVREDNRVCGHGYTIERI